MSSFFNLNESLEDLVRDLKSGAKEFARAMSEEAEARGYGEGCFNPKDFNFRFDALGFPKYNTYNREDGSLVFEFLLPGFEESGINLSFKGDKMILKAALPESLRSGTAEGRKQFLRDIDRREYPVPADRYNQPASKAAFRNGVLTVTIPEIEEDLSGTIKVEIVKEGN
jgi:HSP20 family molecular chaperone IbpA